MQKVFEKLRAFGLKDRHLSVLEILSPNKHLSAHEICSLTKIPRGRIYEVLNFLLSYELISRSEKKPYVYHLDMLRERISDFLQVKFDELLHKQNEILTLLSTKQNYSIDVVHSAEEFAMHQLKIFSDGREQWDVVRSGSIPFVLYPRKLEDALKMRRCILAHRESLSHTTHAMTHLALKSYRDALEHKKKIHCIITRKSLEANIGYITQDLGKKFLNKWKKEMMELIEHYPLEVHVVQEKIPFNILISPSRVSVTLIHLGVTTGVVINDPNVIRLYKEYYDDLRQKARPLSEFF